MTYVNFKEEVFVAKKQINKRRANNNKIFETLSKTKGANSEYNPDKKYSFKEHKELFLGGKSPKKEDEFEEIKDLDIICAKFIKCKFSNIKFNNCKFIACYFEDCDFIGGGVVFENCTFVKKDSDEKPNLNKEGNFSCEFNKCNIYAKFKKSTIEYIIFDKCNLKDTNFESSDMSSGMIFNSDLDMVIISDTDLSGAKIVNTYIKDLEFRDKNISKMDVKTFIDKIKLREKTRDEYEGIYTVYENIADKFKENSLENNFGEYYFLCRKTQRNCLKPIPKFTSTIQLIICGYGERPSYSIYFSLFMILLFTVLYLIFGIKVNDEIITYSNNFDKIFNSRELLRDLNESLNLSVGMFTGIGLNEAQPSPRSYMLSNIEMITGISMLGIGMASLVKKIVR